MNGLWRKLRNLLLTCTGAAMLLFAGCTKKEADNFVVVYTSQDQVYAEPIFREFTKQTGIEVRPVFDSESAKTAGLANRLRFEKDNPQCDLFWNNEELHTRLLAKDGVLGETNGWRALGYRTRRVVVNTNLVKLTAAPKSLLELTNEVWRGKVALAYPLFGTTATHFHALHQKWGDELWKRWCYGLTRNQAKVVDGNSMVVKLVGAGEAAIGLTDSDDIAAGKLQNFPIMELPAGPELIAIPNTIGIPKFAPHPENAQVLAAFLSRPEVLQQLVDAHALEGADFSKAPGNLLKIDWSTPLQDLQQSIYFLKLIFVRS